MGKWVSDYFPNVYESFMLSKTTKTNNIGILFLFVSINNVYVVQMIGLVAFLKYFFLLLKTIEWKKNVTDFEFILSYLFLFKKLVKEKERLQECFTILKSSTTIKTKINSTRLRPIPKLISTSRQDQYQDWVDEKKPRPKPRLQ